jgi:predicted kinase
MTTLYVLVGVPGSGKTTWIGHQRYDWDNTVIVSTDRFVDQYAALNRKTYTEVFQEYMPTAVEKMAQAAIEAFRDNKVVVWDQTSTSVSTRAKKLRIAPSHYKKIAVVFQTPRKDIHDKFLNRPGKEIPKEVINDMIAKFEYPTLEEGFDKIIDAKLKGIDL